VLGQLVVRERLVGRAEGYGLGFDLLDAAAGADRLVVETGPGGGLAGVGPLGEHRVDESRAGARNVGGERRSSQRDGNGNGGDTAQNCVFHVCPFRRLRGGSARRRSPAAPASLGRVLWVIGSAFMSVGRRLRDRSTA